MSSPISINQAVMLSGGIAGAYTLGKFAHSHNNRNLIVAGFALSGLALGYSLTFIVLRKAKIQDNNGWEDLGMIVYAGAGILLLGVSAIAPKFVGKK